MRPHVVLLRSRRELYPGLHIQAVDGEAMEVMGLTTAYESKVGHWNMQKGNFKVFRVREEVKVLNLTKEDKQTNKCPTCVCAEVLRHTEGEGLQGVLSMSLAQVPVVRCDSVILNSAKSRC